MLGGFGAAFDAIRRIERERQRRLNRQAVRYERHARRRRHRVLAAMADRDPPASAPSHKDQISTAPVSRRICPECSDTFLVMEVEGIPIDMCMSCGGIWFDANELKRLTHSEADIPAGDLDSRRSKYKCPVCGTKMRQYLYQKHHDLWVDKCPNEHGVYLERGELTKALEITDASPPTPTQERSSRWADEPGPSTSSGQVSPPPPPRPQGLGLFRRPSESANSSQETAPSRGASESKPAPREPPSRSDPPGESANSLRRSEASEGRPALSSPPQAEERGLLRNLALRQAQGR